MALLFSIIIIIAIAYTISRWGSMEVSEATFVFIVTFCSIIGLIYFIPFGNPITNIFHVIVKSIEDATGINKIVETPAAS